MPDSPKTKSKGGQESSVTQQKEKSLNDIYRKSAQLIGEISVQQTKLDNANSAINREIISNRIFLKKSNIPQEVRERVEAQNIKLKKRFNDNEKRIEDLHERKIKVNKIQKRYRENIQSTRHYAEDVKALNAAKTSDAYRTALDNQKERKYSRSVYMGAKASKKRK